MRSVNKLTSTLITIAILTGCTNVIEGTPLVDNTLMPSVTPTNIEKPTIEPPTFTPEGVKTFNVCRNRSEAANCPVTWEDLDAFVEFAKSVDNTTFPPDVKIPPSLRVIGPPGPEYQKYLFWRDVDGSDETLTAFYLANPDKLNQRTLLYGGLDRGGWTSSIRIVKYLNPSGRISYLTFFGQIDGLAKDNISAWPVAQGMSEPFDSPETVSMIQQWADTGECPVGLNGKWLQEYDSGGH